MNQGNNFGRDEQVAAIVGALVGAVPGGILIQFADGWGAMRYFAWLIDADTTTAAWGVWFGLALVAGTVFGIWMSRSINGFTNTIIMVSRKSEVTQRLLVPLLHRSALGVTANAMGLIYGNVLAFGFFAYVVPLFLLLNGRPTIYPLADFAAIGGILVYSTVMGTTYGLLLEAKWFTPSQWTGEVAATGDDTPTGYIAMVVAALLGAVAALLAGGTWMFRGFAVVSGLSGVFTGILVWTLAAVVLGFLFVATVSRVLSRVARPLVDTPVEFVRRTLAGGALGVVHGLLLGVLLVAVTTVVPDSFFPRVGLFAVAMTVVYGTVLGVYTGYVREERSPTVVVADRLVGDEDSSTEEPTTEESPPERGGFAAWRVRRPFSGGLLLVLSGIIIAAIPIQLQSFQLTAGASKAALGIVFGAMIVACGLFALLRPGLSTLAGVTAIAMSLLSLIGAFGGLVIGMLVGIVGGNLCIAWQNPVADEEETREESRFEWLGGDQQRW